MNGLLLRHELLRDGLSGAAALLVALWLAAPEGMPGPAWWLLGLPVGAAAGVLARQLAARWPFHPVLALAPAAGAVALGCAALAALAPGPASPNPAWPLLHGLVLFCALLATRPPLQGALPAARLLDRPQRLPDPAQLVALVAGQRVLITGAGGSIGSELARQVAALGPARLILLEQNEYALWRVDLALAETHPSIPRLAVLADIRDRARIAAVMQEHRPALVLHAAALKHVPMLEAAPAEAVLTNVLGTRHVADAARAAGCRCFVLVSTDKAVKPASVMGASKRLAELYVRALDQAGRQSGGMRAVSVRFGNVLGSSGSVVELFARQIARGSPLTITHPAMRRYFMTVEEAVGLILCAAALPEEAGEGGLFVLDMGQPIRILDLARRMMRLEGRVVPIRFTGPRPGEKLTEELFHGEEPPRPTRCPGLLAACPPAVDPALITRAVEELASLARAGEEAALRRALTRLLPEYAPQAVPRPDARGLPAGAPAPGEARPAEAPVLSPAGGGGWRAAVARRNEA
ncbi:MAG: polysaccharide biosynthesis protein [Rhodovarius sp.]|nr:polysaccharide biosynthesis protein [Rhodovarius sp.]